MDDNSEVMDLALKAIAVMSGIVACLLLAWLLMGWFTS